MTKFKVGDLVCPKDRPQYHCRVVSIANDKYHYAVESGGDFSTIGDYNSVGIESMEKNGRLVTKLDKVLK